MGDAGHVTVSCLHPQSPPRGSTRAGNMAASSSGLGGFSGLGMDAGDFLARYRQVLNKLKKRFLRKPNVAEAGEQFAQLGRELRAQECLPYVSRVLLLLLLQPPPAKLLPEHAHTLEKYSWEAFDSQGQESSGQLPEDLFLLLQSLVMAAHEKDTEAVKALQVEMWPLLSAEQNHLLHLVLQETISPSGQGIG
ncbi:PREDICTED: factor VIII intron 22 protein-like [Myotis davidii]|uniref:factor VIII intron 22 protein-like n=1 Tax=Myotis davidii TaxID=225400 RepID=UPI0003EBC9B4|nr:PREDICTED: factor VIII intron 22 protein-like [Myotis davidii]